MKYMGSKNRIAKHILPIMLKEMEEKGYTTWVEPFVGGGNMIDKVPDKYERIGCDLNEHTIAAMLAIRDFPDSLPCTVTEEEYKSIKGTPPSPITSWIRFVASYSGKFDNGYARQGNSLKYRSSPTQEGKRNALKQSPKIQDVEFLCCSYFDLTENITNSIIYCFDELTEVLTETGWKYIKDVNIGEKCLSREPNSKKLEYKDVVYTTQYHHKGDMFSYQSKMVDMLVTPDHNLFVSKKIGRNKERADVFLKPIDIDNFNFQFVSAGGDWQGHGKRHYSVDGVIMDAKKFAYLLGIFITDGSVNIKKSVTISQSKPHILDKIRNVLIDLDIPYSEYLPDKGLTTFYLKKPFAKYFEQFYIKSMRRIPKDILEYDKDVLSSLLEGIMDGDGDGRRIYLESKELAGDIQELCYKVGKSSTFHKRSPTVRKLKCGREIVGTKDYYSVSVNNNEYLSTNKNYGKFVKYDGMVYCVTLSEWHTVLTRRNGKCVWLGQCDPPYQGTTGYKTGAFNHEEFFQWCRDMKSKGNSMFISEYNAPNDFELVWEGEVKTNFSSTRKTATHNAVEKLFKV